VRGKAATEGGARAASNGIDIPLGGRLGGSLGDKRGESEGRGEEIWSILLPFADQEEQEEKVLGREGSVERRDWRERKRGRVMKLDDDFGEVADGVDGGGGGRESADEYEGEEEGKGKAVGLGGRGPAGGG
jgi:hypothetical protein